MQRYEMIKLNILKLIGWCLLIYFLTVICFYFVSIIPLKRELVQLEQRSEGLKKEVEQLKGQYVQKWESKKEEILNIIDSFRQKKGDKDIILAEIFKISQDSGIDTERTEPLKDEILGDTMIKYSWRINCRADYSAMGTFLNQIDRDSLFLCVEAPSIQSSEDLQKSFSQSKQNSIAEQLKHKAEFLISTYRFKIKE